MAKQKGKVEQVGDMPTGNEVSAPMEAPTDMVSAPAPALPKFRAVPLSESKYQRGMFKFANVGDTFYGWFVRCLSKNDPDAVGKYDAIEFEGWPHRAPVLLPGNVQLWEFFNDVIAEDDERRGHLFAVTLVERVMDKDKPEEVKFLRFHIGEEDTEAAS